MKTPKTIQIENEILTPMGNLLNSLSLEEKQSSARRRFIRMIKPFIEDCNTAVKEVQEKYGKKDEKGDFIRKEGAIQYTKENEKKGNAEWQNFLEESITIDVTPANEKDIDMVCDIFEDELKKFSKEKNGKFNGDEYDHIDFLERTVKSLTV